MEAPYHISKYLDYNQANKLLIKMQSVLLPWKVHFFDDSCGGGRNSSTLEVLTAGLIQQKWDRVARENNQL